MTLDRAPGPASFPSKRPAIFKDRRLRHVKWRDLLTLSPWERLHELSLSLPWLTASLYCYDLALRTDAAWMIAGGICAFYFFLTGLRQSHNAQHYNMGISRRSQDWLLFSLSILMQSSMHAVQVTHMHHHRHCLAEHDVEAFSARMPWYRALLLGPLFTLRLHYHALRLCRSANKRRWILCELGAILVWLIMVFGLLGIETLQVHALLMLIGQCGTGFFAVWTVHHDCDAEHFIGRTQRGRWKNFISYNMFYHIEHHLFPAVPTCHLPELARRLDQAAPELRQKNVY